MKILKICMVVIFILFGGVTTFLNVYGIKLGVDFQNKACIGRVFYYQEKVLKNGVLKVHNPLKEGDFRVGNLYAFKLLNDIGFYKKGDVLLKRVIADFASDKVKVTKDSVIVTSKKTGITNIYPVKLPSKYQKKYEAEYELKTGEVFIIGDKDDSYDSRFLGPVSIADAHIYKVLL